MDLVGLKHADARPLNVSATGTPDLSGGGRTPAGSHICRLQEQILQRPRNVVSRWQELALYTVDSRRVKATDMNTLMPACAAAMACTRLRMHRHA